MTDAELAALQPIADQLAAAGTWTRADFGEADSDWQAPLATACNYFPALVAEVLRLQAGIADLRINHRDCYDPTWRADDPAYPCECGANAHNARIAALLGGTS